VAFGRSTQRLAFGGERRYGSCVEWGHASCLTVQSDKSAILGVVWIPGGLKTLVVAAVIASVAATGCERKKELARSGAPTHSSGVASPTASATPHDSGTEISQPPIPPPRTITPIHAEGDVTLAPARLRQPGLVRTVATVVNHSRQLSDYQIAVMFTSTDHKRKLGPGSGMAKRVRPGQKVTVEILLLTEAKGPYGVSLTSALRFGA